MSLGGVDITRAGAHERAHAGLGRSFQDARMFHSMTVLDTLRVARERNSERLASRRRRRCSGWRRHPGGGAGGDRRRAEDIVEEFGLAAYRDKLVGELSTGTRRVVDLACLLIQRPKVILLDEPSSGIAQREAEALGPMLRQVRDELGCALVLIEHDMPLVLGLVDRLYALETGRVIAQRRRRRTSSPIPRVVRSYLGDDPAAINRSG